MAQFDLMAIDRLRMLTDGEGVTTLVAARACPLKCRYCINDICHKPGGNFITPEDLYERVKIDDLYFRKTGGGMTFGGGEPLLYADFIKEFARLAPDWKIYIETCLNVPVKNVMTAAEAADGFIIDIKDMDKTIYKNYTQADNARVYENLEYLIKAVGSEKLTVRVPLIPSYNTETDRKKSREILINMGIKRLDMFEYQIRNV